MKITNGTTSYYLTIKRKDNEKEEIRTNKVISKLEYLYYLTQKDENIEPLEKIRYSFQDGKEVYNLDIFKDSNEAILENETTKEIELLKLPIFLHIIGSYKDNLILNNKSIAKKRVLKKTN